MPIRLRLALWYGTLTGLVVVLVCLVVYVVHTRAHYDDLDRLLASTGEHVAEEYAAASGPAARAETLSAPMPVGVVVRAYGSNGRVAARSPNAESAPRVDPRAVLRRPSGPAFDRLAALAPPIVDVGGGRGAFGLKSAPDGARWRVYAVPLSDADGYLVAASPLDRIDASVNLLRLLVAVLAGVGAVGTMAAGLLLAGRALRPVNAMTQTAAAIARSRDFGRRVPVDGIRDELGRLAETFNDMLAALEHAYQAQKRFVADASHELRAPLTAIQGNLELLLRHQDAPPAQKDVALREADREAHRLSQLVADLLALARADAGVPIRRQKVELDRVVLEALATAQHLAGERAIELAALEPALIEGDPDRLKELFLILLDNAIRYTLPEEPVVMELRRRDENAEVIVRDEGVGIAPEDLPKVFERFYRADPARTRDPGGTGLGLPIARWIAGAHGGHIELVSKPKGGTTVSVRLPLRKP
jgi:signal transduction histidine kinase